MRKLLVGFLLLGTLLAQTLLYTSTSLQNTNAADKTKIAVTNDYDDEGNLNDPVIDNWEPSKLNQNITDPKNMLGSSRSRVISAINTAISQVGENVFVVFIPRFDGAINGEDWCKKTAEKSNLASNAVIFAVAYDRGEQTIYIPRDSQKLDPSKISTVSEIAQKFLSQGDWGKSAEAVINAIIALTDKPIYIPFITYGIIILMVLLMISAVIYKLLHRQTGGRRRQTSKNILGLGKKDIEKLSHKEEFDPTQTSTTLTAIKIEETSTTNQKITQDMINENNNKHK